MTATVVAEHWRAIAAKAVRGTVRRYQLRGLKTPYAMEQASLALGISRHRLRGIYYGEVFAESLAEYRHIKERFLAHLDAEAAVLEQRAAAERALRQQLEIQWSESSGSGSACNSTAARSSALSAIDKAEARYRKARRGAG